MKVICISRGRYVSSLRICEVYHVLQIFSSTNSKEEYKLEELPYFFYPSELFMDIKEYRKQRIKNILDESY